jgi:hypothetical protein
MLHHTIVIIIPTLCWNRYSDCTRKLDVHTVRSTYYTTMRSQRTEPTPSTSYGQIDPAHALQHFHREGQLQHYSPHSRGSPAYTPIDVHVRGRVHGKEISSLKEILPADRWAIHYIAHKETRYEYPSSHSGVYYIERIILIDNCGDIYELKRDQRSQPYPGTYEINHPAGYLDNPWGGKWLPTIQRDPTPLPHNLTDLYKTVSTPDLGSLFKFTQLLYSLAKQQKNDAEELARLRQQHTELLATVTAAKEEEERLRTTLATRDAELLALL